MEAPELDGMGSHSSSSSEECLCPCPATVTMKRKRTKRPRAAVPQTAATSSTDVSATCTEEEEDMAHCLILLAQGRALDSSPPTERFTSRRFTEAATTAGGRAGLYVYECKTCSKCFPSFQALGGHRASHKKPRIAIEGDINKNQVNDDQFCIATETTTVVLPLANSPTGNNKMRVHECSICGAEFSSGQALGGHMRRHRPIAATPELIQEVKKERNVLSLDLNLPAPSDENSPQLQFSYADKQRPMVFSAASALVDCHY